MEKIWMSETFYIGNKHSQVRLFMFLDPMLYDLVILLLDIYPREIKRHIYVYMMFMTILVRVLQRNRTNRMCIHMQRDLL